MTPIIKRHIVNFESLYQNYKRKPEWYKLKSMFNVTLQLGIEIGKEINRINSEMFKDDATVEPCIIRESQRTPVALKHLLEIYKHGEIEFDSKQEADKTVDQLRAYCRYNELEFKFSKKENKVILV